MINLKEAIDELDKKSYREIQEETAWKWASRACASYQNCAEANEDRKLVFWTIAEEFYHEAIEHGALVEGKPALLQSIRDAVHDYQEEAAISMGVDPDAADVV